ncbi:hypothetical protein GJB61_09950 [Paenibacillus sp. LC-T2]|uniref:GerMN domain-containing protein n=1 Tax=Paenibacillus monticola TaxID=2666075 RepID=A0A7X2H5V5_9BACL|nr:hypothetical protein [Paenibacillus monticola]
MNKKLSHAGIAALLLLVIAGCGEKPAAAPSNEAGQNSSTVVSGAGENTGNTEGTNGDEGQNSASTAQPTASATPASTEPAAPEKQSQSIAVYFTDSQLMDLVPAKATISFADDVEKYTEAFKALQASDNTELVSLWSKIELKSLKYENGQVLMDIHKPEEAQLGAGGEAFAISALTQTFFQFSEVKSVEMLVDGEQVESLMGHVDLEHPMTRENSGL